MLAGLDERRARRLGVQGEPLPADADAAIAEAMQAHRLDRRRRERALADRRAAAAELAERYAMASRSAATRRRLPACFIVPALGAERTLVGAFYIDDGTIDRDTYLVARDLAARVALAVEREQAVSELDDARRLAALGQFAAAIAHDIRTPLTSISLNVQILRRKLQLPDDDREHLDIALEELARLDKSVAEILDFAKPVKLAPQAIDVGELLEDAARACRRCCPRRASRCAASRAASCRPSTAIRSACARCSSTSSATPPTRRTPGAEVTVRASRADAAQRRDRGRGSRPRHQRRRPAAHLRAVLHDAPRRHRPRPRDLSQGRARARRRHPRPLDPRRGLDVHRPAAGRLS